MPSAPLPRNDREGDVLFDVDFLSEPPNTAQQRLEQTNQERSGFLLQDDSNRYNANYLFPQETIDFDQDENIENDIVENPFMDDTAATWNNDKFARSRHGSRLGIGNNRIGGNALTNFFANIRDRLGIKRKRYQSFEMTDYNNNNNNNNNNNGDNHGTYERSRNMFDIKVLFNRYVLRKHVPSTNDGGPRIIYISDSAANSGLGYGDNHISTTKYNAATFLPKFLFQEFSKYANLFFLLTSIIQQVPHVSPTNRYTTVGTLLVVLVVSAIKECVEDIKRVRSDNELNNANTEVFSELDDGFIQKRWIDIRVGDIVKVNSEEAVPADMIILSSSEPEGLCYIETANLDGETNLKIKQSRPETSKYIDVRTLGSVQGNIQSEQPNSSLYTYDGTLLLNGQEIPLTPDQMILRGATLRNTAWMFGIVVFTGHETKLMRNATATPIKKTAVERIINLQITVLFGVLIVLSLISALGNVIMSTADSKHLPYLYLKGTNKAGLFFRDLLTFWILFSNLVPISLFVTVELIKYYQAFMISSDLDLYDEETDTPTVVRTSSLVEELGQIEYIFSDKTGTLTRNVMEFKSCSIAGCCYIETIPEDKTATYQDGIEVGYRKFDDLKSKLQSQKSDDLPLIENFLTLLATCHTVIPEIRADGSIKYQAASPDEGALVQGAALLGYKFTIRKPSSVIIYVEETGEERIFELLKICEFNSSRKRMSAIFRTPEGSIRLYCKGADTVIMERLAADKNPYVDSTLRHLEEYASEGFRTLCIAMKEIPEAAYIKWSKIYDVAATSLDNRHQKLEDAAELIEKDLVLLGATAIEDKLQDGVPETIHTLQEAGLKMWVLTGDRQETAINIGMSCRLLSEDMNLLIINEETKEKTSDNMVEKLDAIHEHKVSTQEMDTLALVIDGKSLAFALEPDLEDYLLALGKMCKAVICCRVSPLQKALVVKMVKNRTVSSLLAIGDGANDVSMIQAAHVGVGISGKEGMQASRSADFAIGEFKYLKKLLLVHGSWSYHRISMSILYSFYKNIALYMTQFWYGFSNAFSGESIMESWTLTFYNVFFTALPPFVIGVFDQFISSRLLERYPQLYKLGQKGKFFSVSIFWGWIMNGFYHSAIIYVGSVLFYRYGAVLNKHGEVADHWSWGVAVFTTSLAIVLGKAALITNQWTKFTFVAIPGSFLLWIIFFPIYAAIFPHANISREYYGVLSHTYPSAIFWLMLIVLTVFALMRDFVWKYYRRMYAPEPYHVVQEMQKYNISDYRPHAQQFQSAIRKVRQVQRMKKQRGFAFSQSEDGGQERIIRMYDTTQKRGIHGELHDASVDPFADENYVNVPSNPFSDKNHEPTLVNGDMP